MLARIIKYFNLLASNANHWAEAQFFTPILSGAPAACRLAIGFACLIFFNSWYGSLPNWISIDGPLNADVARLLIVSDVEGTGSDFRLSPLYQDNNAVISTVLLASGTIMSLVLITGYGGRIVPIIVLAIVLMVLHRVSMIQSIGENLLCGILPYLAIDNGWLTLRNRVGFADNRQRWTAGLTIAMIRWHLTIWLCASFAGHLAQDMWWSGNAVWNIASREQSPLFTASFFAERAWLSAALGSCWLILHLAFIVCLIVKPLRPLGIVVGCLFWLGIYLLAGDWLYATIGLAATSCIFYESSMIVRSFAKDSLSQTSSS
jgi:hypothetical protein